MVARFLPAPDVVRRALGEGETGVVVSHGAALRVVVPAFLGGAGDISESLGVLSNCGWVVLEHAASTWTGGVERWRLDGLEPGRVSERAREVDVALSRRLARVMDDAVIVPGTRFGLGLDAVIGLVPGIGDAVGSALSSVIVRDAIRARVPMAVLAWMGLNLVVDALLGLVPGVGDLLDVAHRANRKNLRLLLREVERQPLREPPSTAYVVGAVALMVVPVLAGLVVTVLGFWLLWRWLT